MSDLWAPERFSLLRNGGQLSPGLIGQWSCAEQTPVSMINASGLRACRDRHIRRSRYPRARAPLKTHRADKRMSGLEEQSNLASIDGRRPHGTREPQARTILLIFIARSAARALARIPHSRIR